MNSDEQWSWAWFVRLSRREAPKKTASTSKTVPRLLNVRLLETSMDRHDLTDLTNSPVPCAIWNLRFRHFPSRKKMKKCFRCGVKLRDEELVAHRLQHSQHVSCPWCPFQVLWDDRAKDLSAHVNSSHPVVCKHQKLWRENSAPLEAEVAGYNPSS